MRNLVKGMMVATLAAIVGAGIYLETTQPEPTPYIEKKVIVNSGQTLWEICESTTLWHEDIREMIERVKRDNGIENVGTIQPGQELIVRVKTRR